MPEEGYQRPPERSRRVFLCPLGLFFRAFNTRKGTIIARTPTGTITSVATAFATDVTITGISNAAVAVVTTSASHGLVDGDIIMLESSWSRLNMRAFRVVDASGSTLKLDGEDTSNIEIFPAGGGGGKLRKVNAWVQLDRTLNHNSSGGEARTVNVKFIESENEIVLNDGFTAINRTFDMDADQLGTAGYTALRTFTQTGKDTVIRQATPGNTFNLIVGKVSLSEEVVLTDGQVMVVRGSIAAQSRSTRYAV